MSSCLHKNLCRYYVSFMDDSDLWLVMPLLGAGSVVDIMKLKYQNGIKDEAMIATILKEVIEGLMYLHNQSQIHRDIKAGNILMDESGEILLCDFGVSAHIKVGQPRTTFVGSPCWMAPEVMEQTDGYDFKADLWSLGITALELANGDAPNSELPAMRVLLAIINQPPPTLSKNEDWSAEFRHLVESCLQKEPTQRPTAKNLLKECKKFFDKAQSPDYVCKNFLKGLDPLEARVGVHLQKQAEEYFDKKQKKNSKEKKETIAWDFSGMSSGEYDSKKQYQSKMQQQAGVRNNHFQAHQKNPDNELDDFDLEESEQTGP